VAVGEDFIDGMNMPLAVAGRRTRAERRGELWTRHGLPPLAPSGEAFGLARQIVEGQLEGLEAAVEALRVDPAIILRGGSLRGLGPWPEVVNPGTRPEKQDARGIFRVFHPGLTQLGHVFAGISEPEGGRPAAPTLSDLAPLGHGPGGGELYHETPGGDDNEAPDGGLGGPEHLEHGAVQGLRDPPSRIGAVEPQQGEKGFYYPPERFAVAFDNQVPVHVVSIP